MLGRSLTALVHALWIPAAVAALPAQESPARFVFMEPAKAESPSSLPVYATVVDPARRRACASWVENDPARWALALYARAWEIMRERGQEIAPGPALHVALVPGGNHVDVGFQLRTESGWEQHPDLPYVKLGPEPELFVTTLYHETGHAALGLLSEGSGIPVQPIASIPHTTAALTNRGTAFNEGFSIHLETLVGHLHQGAAQRREFHHESFDFSNGAGARGEYFRAAADLRTFAQSQARYLEVRENTFAFAAAHTGPDYLRVQLEKSRDFATLRDANQLLQSEGFYASFFFATMMRGDGIPPVAVLDQRRDRLLTVFAEMFELYPAEEDAPYLVQIIETYADLYPDDADEVVNVFLDLSHGVFVDPDAASLWRQHYLAALQLDQAGLGIETILRSRKRWREDILDNPEALYTRLGPQLPCRVPARSVKLVVFGQAAPLSFDLNTVQPGILRMIPGVTEQEISLWLTERQREPFADVEDFDQRVTLADQTRGQLRF